MQSLQVFLTHNMKITVALVSLSASMSVSGERAQTISKRAVRANEGSREGFLAPEDSFKFRVDCDGMRVPWVPEGTNCTQVT